MAKRTQCYIACKKSAARGEIWKFITLLPLQGYLRSSRVYSFNFQQLAKKAKIRQNSILHSLGSTNFSRIYYYLPLSFEVMKLHGSKFKMLVRNVLIWLQDCKALVFFSTEYSFRSTHVQSVNKVRLEGEKHI